MTTTDKPVIDQAVIDVVDLDKSMRTFEVCQVIMMTPLPWRVVSAHTPGTPAYNFHGSQDSDPHGSMMYGMDAAVVILALNLVPKLIERVRADEQAAKRVADGAKRIADTIERISEIEGENLQLCRQILDSLVGERTVQ